MGRNKLITSTLALSIKTVLFNTAHTCELKRKTTDKPNKVNVPWFDSECRNYKNEIHKLGKSLKVDPLNEAIRQVLNKHKKTLKHWLQGKTAVIRKTSSIK